MAASIAAILLRKKKWIHLQVNFSCFKLFLMREFLILVIDFPQDILKALTLIYERRITPKVS